MFKKAIAGLAAVALGGMIAMSIAPAGATPPSRATDQPVFDPGNFVSVIDNPYFPLPVGRVLVYSGYRDGVTQTDTVTVTNQTKVILGVTATVVSDVAMHGGTLLEQTSDWYAQDRDGNVWYLGEDTKAYGPHGKIDTSGSWEAGVNGAIPGLIMEGHPAIPDAYRQELLTGQAEDTAWIVGTTGTVKVAYGNVRNILTTLEATRIEPGIYDTKIYGPGLGIVQEKSLDGTEFAELVSVTG